uniref:Uncharacterized protein n=1 Tax=Lepeophtheirus salmonis TaxID=72036 RepID=A0A0K2V5U4_LEPSM
MAAVGTTKGFLSDKVLGINKLPFVREDTTFGEGVLVTLDDDISITLVDDIFITLGEDVFITLGEDVFITLGEDVFITLGDDVLIPLGEEVGTFEPSIFLFRDERGRVDDLVDEGFKIEDERAELAL